MSQKKAKNNKHNKKNKNNKNYIKIVFIIILILLCFIIVKNKSIKHNYEKMQIIIDNENITENIEKPLIIEKEHIYMSYNDIKSFLDNTLYIEDQTNLIITASDKKIGVINPEEQTLKINGSNVEVKNITLKKDEDLYIAISELKKVYNYEIEYLDKTNIIIIDNLNKKCIKAYAKKNMKIKKEKNKLSTNLEEIKKGNWLYFINEENEYSKVRTQNGIIGYVKKNTLDNFINEREDFIEEKKIFKEENSINKDISKVDISSFEKRQNIINLILQEAIKNDKMYVEISYNGENNIYYERFKIEVVPILHECGIEVKI